MQKDLNATAEYPCQLAALSTIQIERDELYDERLYRVKCRAMVTGATIRTPLRGSVEDTRTPLRKIGSLLIKSLCSDCECRKKLEEIRYERRESE